jgi:hypothetical protein
LRLCLHNRLQTLDFIFVFTEKNVEEVKACPAKEIRRAILHEHVPAHTLLWICNAIVRNVDDGGGKPQRVRCLAATAQT